MYEKALVASGIKGSIFHSRRYEDIKAGFTDEAFGYITGQKAEVVYDNFTTGFYDTANHEKSMKKKDEKTGKTVYTKKFEENVTLITERLKKHIQRGDILTATAYREFQNATGEGTSGEMTRRAIASRHGFTVTGIESIEGKEYVHIRNPWGKSVAETVKQGLTGKNVIRASQNTDRSMTFLMEMHDFVEHMFEVTAVDSKKFANAAKKAAPKA
jgi:hypothetical protein